MNNLTEQPQFLFQHINRSLIIFFHPAAALGCLDFFSFLFSFFTFVSLISMIIAWSLIVYQYTTDILAQHMGAVPIALLMMCQVFKDAALSWLL